MMFFGISLMQVMSYQKIITLYTLKILIYLKTFHL